MIKATGDSGTQWILYLCNGFVNEGCIPEEVTMVQIHLSLECLMMCMLSVVLQIYKGKRGFNGVSFIEEINCWNML